MELMDQNKPKTLSQFLGNFKQKMEISAFLKSKNYEPIIIVGPNGSGKSTFIDIALNDFAKDNKKMYIEYNTISNHKDLITIVDNFLKNKSIMECLTKSTNSTKFVIFDDINILINIDKFALKYIIELINKKNCKIIISVNIEDEKKISDITKKYTNILKLGYPSVQDCLQYFMDIKPDNVDDNELLVLIKNCNCNIRQIFLNFDNTSYKQEYVYDSSIFDLVNNIFNTGYDMQSLIVQISSDPTIISYIMYENYINYIHETSKEVINKKDVHEICSTFIDCSIMETYNYTCNDGSINDLYNVLRCAYIINVINCYNRKKQSINLKYTTILSRVTQYYSNQKKYNRLLFENDLGIENVFKLWDVQLNNGKMEMNNDENTLFNAFLKIT